MTCFQLLSDNILEAFSACCLQDRLPSLTFKALHYLHSIYRRLCKLFSWPAHVPETDLSCFNSSHLLTTAQLLLQPYSPPKTHFELLPLTEHEKTSAHRSGVSYMHLALSNRLPIYFSSPELNCELLEVSNVLIRTHSAFQHMDWVKGIRT